MQQLPEQPEQLATQSVAVVVDSDAVFERAAEEAMLRASERGNIGDVEIEDEGANAVIDKIGQRLRAEFDEAERHRAEREEEWLRDLRQYKGVYDPEVKANMDPRRSQAFIRLTRAKVRATDARLADMLFPAGDKNWMIKASPVPSMPESDANALREQIMMRDGEVDEDALQAALKELAEERASSMSEEIDDQLSEGNFPAVAREVMHSGHLYGTGILKGPMVETKPMRRWVNQTFDDGSTAYIAVEESRVRPFFHAVSIWNIYPDPYAIRLEECDYIWERHVLTRHEVRKLKRRPGFDKGRIDRYLREHPKGNGAVLKNHETELRAISDTRSTIAQPVNRYELLERWGYLDGQQLADMGVEVPDDVLDQEFEAVVWLLGDVVVKAALNPFETGSRPYKFYYFEKDETSIWGVGIPSLMRDPQKLFNASIRMMVDNAAISSGPQVELNLDLLSNTETDITSLVPHRIWTRKGRGADAMAPLMKVYQIDSKVQEYMKMAELFMSFGDESTSIPRFTYGNTDGSQVSKTVGGLSMLMGQANVVLKDVVKNWDDGITTPFISDIYAWNMQFSDKEEIKGDYDVIARGASSLVAKEIRSQALDAFAASLANPVDAPYVKRGDLNRERAVALDLNPESFLRTEDEVTQINAMKEQFALLQQVVASVANRLGMTPEQLIGAEMQAQQAEQQQQQLQQAGEPVPQGPAAQPMMQEGMPV